MKSSGWVLPLLGVMLLALIGAPRVSRAANLQVAKDTEVSFLAKITASSFVAKSTAVSGVVDYDASASAIKSATIKVKTDSFDTGMSLRNSHMRDKYLEAQKFPEIVFQVENAKVAAAAGSEGALEGFFTIKGVKKAAKIPVKVAENSGAKLVVTSSFPLNITDYGIPQPGFTMVKMETVINVTLKLVLTKGN